MFEYKVVPAPVKGVKAKGVKTPEARFALGVEAAINELATEGWEYQRSDVLPSEERVGLTGSTTNWRTLMVFRRVVASEVPMEAPRAPSVRTEPVLTATSPVAALAAPEVEPPARPETTTEVDVADAEFEEGSEETRPA